jgi:hypothetical protein
MAETPRHSDDDWREAVFFYDVGLDRPASPESSEYTESHPSDAEPEFLTGFPLVCLTIGLMLAQFLVSIDRTIISTVSREERPVTM